ncbi:hypothetical protein M0D21_20490 [Aquimarina sp. D1M17]|uniref:hypothetical protein n=1 Tax=Aquimarina acroporae TaxID=2937283 RepID=UPI0020C18324|nr:hypothetical protein [Aquimarina acroporae]MCK8523967.1 hypothetical protein [Aquimarina acroporae]
MKNENKVQTKKIKSAYVFSENNQVYLKHDINSKSGSGHSLHSTEWIPVSFCWEP